MEMSYTTNIIELKEKISFEQYQTAVRLLNAVGIEVKNKNHFTENQIKSIKLGIKQAENGMLSPHEETMEKMKRLCGM